MALRIMKANEIDPKSPHLALGFDQAFIHEVEEKASQFFIASSEMEYVTKKWEFMNKVKNVKENISNLDLALHLVEQVSENLKSMRQASQSQIPNDFGKATVLKLL